MTSKKKQPIKYTKIDRDLLKDYLDGSLEMIKEKGPLYACKYGINLPSLRAARKEVNTNYPKDSKETKQVAYMEKVTKMCKRPSTSSK